MRIPSDWRMNRRGTLDTARPLRPRNDNGRANRPDLAAKRLPTTDEPRSTNPPNSGRETPPKTPTNLPTPRGSLAFPRVSNQTSNRKSATNQGPRKWAPRHDRSPYGTATGRAGIGLLPRWRDKQSAATGRTSCRLTAVSSLRSRPGAPARQRHGRSSWQDASPRN